MTAALTIPLCRLEDIPDGGSCALVAPHDARTARPQALIALRRGRTVWLYVNACPHIGAPLDMEPGQFLNHDKSLILCTMHGALFSVENGLCVQGPCAGKSLTRVPCKIEDGIVHI